MSDDRWQVITGDCLEVLPTLAAGSVDAVVTDPPYGLTFMGKDWDKGVPGVHFWQEALRVAKPGAHLLAFGGTRTFHRLAVAIEDAGWEIRDTVMYLYGSGFPKSHDVSKAIDKAAGEEREVVGPKIYADGKPRTMGANETMHEGWQRPWRIEDPQRGERLTAPATDATRQWAGWGTALKPAWEPVIMARKPLTGTVAQNVLEWGTGGINVDGCRIPANGDNTGRPQGTMPHPMDWGNKSNGNGAYVTEGHSSGRWPANVIHDGSEEVLAGFPVTTSGTGAVKRGTGNGYRPNASGAGSRLAGTPNIEYGDTGSAARFFYTAKASRADRDEGLEGFDAIHRVNGNKWTDQDYRVARGERPPSAESGPRRNHHPTVKPTSLMRYLCRLVTPPGGVILDMFTGSGSTGKAAMLEGFRFIGVELSEEYATIARARIAKAAEQARQLELLPPAA